MSATSQLAYQLSVAGLRGDNVWMLRALPQARTIAGLFTVAPWLNSDEEQTYVSLAGTLLSRFGMTCGFQLGRLKGYHVYGTTVAGTGRNCAYSPRHNSNNFFVAFEKSGNVSYHCYGSECQPRQPLCLGQWCNELMQCWLAARCLRLDQTWMQPCCTI